jgi:hypothetical protein
LWPDRRRCLESLRGSGFVGAGGVDVHAVAAEAVEASAATELGRLDPAVATRDSSNPVGTTESVTPPYEQSGANIAFWTLFGLFAMGEYAMRFRSRFNRGGNRLERWSLLVVVAAVVGGMLGGLELAKWHPASIGVARWPLFVVGLALMGTGVFVRQWAIFVLDRLFTVDVRIHSDQTVADRGPYRWVATPPIAGWLSSSWESGSR